MLQPNCRITHITKLHHLDFYENKIGDVSVKAILSSPILSNLTTLHLQSNKIANEGAGVIAASSTRCNVTKLEIDFNRISVDSTRAIEQSTTLANYLWPNLLNSIYIDTTPAF